MKLSTSIASAPKSNISGQAKFLRAYFYFNLVKLFGGVPLYVHGQLDLSNVNKSRTSADSVYQQIIKDLQDASQELSPYSESDHAAGKATSGGALGLLIEVYAQHRYWSKAASTAKQVVDIDLFGLDKDYEHVYDTAYNNDKEKLFSTQHKKGASRGSIAGANLPFEFGPEPVTLKDGTLAKFSKKGGATWQVNQSFFNATPNTYRKWQTMRNKMPYYYSNNSLVQDTVALSAPFVVKFYHLDTSTGSLMSGVNFAIIRYSAILLSYAEALNEVNKGPTPAAYDAINKVRARARGVGTLHEQPESVYPPLSGLNQSQFRDSVLAEEAREFVGEGQRRLDLLRHDIFISDAQSRGINAQDYRKLFPIPSIEIDRNPNLVQNPGYGK